MLNARPVPHLLLHFFPKSPPGVPQCTCCLNKCPPGLQLCNDIHLYYHSAPMHFDYYLDYHCALRCPPGVRLCTVMLCGTLSVWVTDLPDTADQMWQYVMYRFLTIIYFRISSSSPTSTPHVRLIKLETKFSQSRRRTPWGHFHSWKRLLLLALSHLRFYKYFAKIRCQL